MAVVLKQVTFGTKGTFPIVFSSNAIYKLEEKAGLSTERIGLMLFSGRAGYQMMQVILWAMLESARVREKVRREPFTIEEVGDLLDEEGGSAYVWAEEDKGLEKQKHVVNGVETEVEVKVREPRPLHPICASVMEIWKAAFPQPREIAANPPNASGSENSDVPLGTNG